MRIHPSIHAFVALLVIASGARAQLLVQSVSPPRNAVTASTAGQISVRFASAVNPATVTPGSFRVFGRWSGVVPGSLRVSQGNQVVTFSPSRPFFPGEHVTVNVSAAVQAAAGGSLTGGHTWSFWTTPAPGSASFSLWATVSVRMPAEGPIRTYGAYAGDLDKDGAPDLTFPNEVSDDLRVMTNDGCGAFRMTSAHSVPAGSSPSANEGQDFDGDGWTDLAVAGNRGNNVSIFLGDGTGGFRPATTHTSGLQTRGLAVLDAEGDGDVDVVTANTRSSNLALHLNLGNGTFAPATFFDGGNQETALAAADADNDGIADLFVGNRGSNTVTLLLGRGNGTFVGSASVSVPPSPWMLVAGDVNGDGNVDVVTSCETANMVSIVHGDGAGGLLPAINYPVGAFPIAVDLGDLNGDGALDLVVSSFSGSDFSVFVNQGAGVFGSPTTLPAPQAGSCALLVDHDRDGDLDILGIDELGDVLLVFGQTGPSTSSTVQTPSCEGTFRIDNFANRAGYSAASPHPFAPGASFFAGVTGSANQPYAILAGYPLVNGVSLAFGTFNLASSPLAVLPLGTTDRDGEAVDLVTFPTSAPIGGVFALQAIVLSPTSPAGLTLTNPEQVVFR